MTGNITLTLIKPDAVGAKNAGKIIDIFESNGFEILEMRKLTLSREMAAQFYSIHEGKDFYDRLMEFMTSGPIIAAKLSKENAVEDFRSLIGSTNPELAEEGTIRKQFATSTTFNAVHGSDSDENAQIEANFFFPQR